MAKKRKGGKGGRGGGNNSSGGGARRRNITGHGSSTESSSASDGAPPYVSPRARRAQRESDIGSTLIHLGIIWLVVGVLVQLGKGYVQKQTSADATASGDGGTDGSNKSWRPFGTEDDGTSSTSILKTAQQLAAKAARASMSPSHYGGYAIPAQQLRNMEAYPNPLRITDEMRKEFHPVVVFDTNKSDPYKVMDFTKRQAGDDDKAEDGSSGRPAPGSLIPPDQWTRLMKDRKKSKIITPFTVGRYDEDRRNMYSSDLFDASNGSDARTVHVGIDIGGPVGTKVHAFADGVVHSAGHNPEWGDYGHVIVVEHELPTSVSSNPSDDDVESPASKVYALYGHLDAGSIRGKKPGKRIKKGQVIGKMGDLKDNGGWYDPHVHFQLSTNPPPTHDMPGVVSAADRPKALVEYPDPRLVLGSLY